MQIFELTQTVNEIDWGATAKAVGNRILQAPVRALGQRVGQDLLPPEDDETPRQQARASQTYFDAAAKMIKYGVDVPDMIKRLVDKYGATREEAMTAIDNALDFVENENLRYGPETATQAQQPASTDINQRRANRQRIAQPSTAATTPQSAAPTAPAASPTPEQLRMAKQRAAAARADAEAMPVAPAATPLSQMSPEQQRIMKQKFAGSMARAQMSGSPKPPPTNYGTTVGPAVKPQMTATPALNMPVTKTNLPAPSNVVPIKPGMMPTPTAQNDILQALTKLGFKPKEAAAAVKQVPPNTSTSDAIRQILSRQQPMSESLTWSRDFDPSSTLLKKIRQL
jgi:hypothetical protein